MIESAQHSRNRLSLRIQLTLWVVLIFTLIQWVSKVVVWVILSETIFSDFNDYFIRHSAAVNGEIRRELPNLTRKELTEIESNQLTQVRFHDYYIDAFDLNGERIVEPGNASAQLDRATIDLVINNSSPTILTQTNWVDAPSSFNSKHTVVSLQKVTDRTGTSYLILQATDDLYAQDRVMQMGQTLLIMSLTAPFLALLAGWFISRIAVSPLIRIQQLVTTLNPESLDAPLEIKEESTEVMDLVAQIDDSRDQIRSAFESQARFLSNVSHELKTPIAVMQIESETVDLQGSSEDVKQFVRSVRDEMTRLGKMVESFLTLTRIEDGFGNIKGKQYAFNDLVMDSIDQCIAMSDQSAIELHPVLFADDDTMDLAVQGDSDLLITMLNNLIRNAIRYSPAGGTIKIELEHCPDTQTDHAKRDQFPDQSVFIRVIDEGPGIPADKIEHIFDRFAKVEGTDRAGRGHGLGLAIAQGIAELHGGSIQVTNNPDKGCTFRVQLPSIS